MEITKLDEIYRKNQSLRKTAALVGLSYETVRQRLLKAGFTTRRGRSKRKLKAILMAVARGTNLIPEIGKEVGLADSNVYLNLLELEQQGLISRKRRMKGTIRLGPNASRLMRNGEVIDVYRIVRGSHEPGSV